MQLYLYFRETVKKLQNSLDLSAKPLTSSITISLSKTYFSPIPKLSASSLILMFTSLLLSLIIPTSFQIQLGHLDSESQQKHNKNSLLFDVL